MTRHTFSHPLDLDASGIPYTNNTEKIECTGDKPLIEGDDQ